MNMINLLQPHDVNTVNICQQTPTSFLAPLIKEAMAKVESNAQVSYRTLVENASSLCKKKLDFKPEMKE